MRAEIRTTTLREEAFFFENRGVRLYGMLHHPQGRIRAGNPRSGTGFVFCHPFGDEAFRTHREIVVYARSLAAMGHHVLRFDCRGCGDSEGDFSLVTLEAHVSDIRSAITLIKDKCSLSSLGLIGLRFGAALAAAAAARDERVDSLILWAPIVDGKRYFQFLAQSQMAHELGNFGSVSSSRKSIVKRLEQGGSFDLMANRISPELYRELVSFDPWSGAVHKPKNVAVIGFAGAREGLPDLEILKEKYIDSVFYLIREKLFWFDKVFQDPMELYKVTTCVLRDFYPDSHEPV
ncbi:MAG: alpha/beta fold hydrolase [Desulfobacteraceae bacterium]